MKHTTIEIITERGEKVKAIAPVIISASRATDIPAFYAKEFFADLLRGYSLWRNPFNGKISYVSYVKTRFIVFWTKNPQPILPYIDLLQEYGIRCYFQFTLNDYESEQFEPNLPTLKERIQSFQQLSAKLGAKSVVWRFDPLILADNLGIEELLQKITGIADCLNGYTDVLVFSFADIVSYAKVVRNMQSQGVRYKEWTSEEMVRFAARISQINRQRWNFRLATCAEPIHLEEFDIEHNRCIDPERIKAIAGSDAGFSEYLLLAKKDSGQRKFCGCITAKDIGAYNTCPHGCVYCYANTSPHSAQCNYQRIKNNKT